jgi:hypothetical protein
MDQSELGHELIDKRSLTSTELFELDFNQSKVR